MMTPRSRAAADRPGEVAVREQNQAFRDSLTALGADARRAADPADPAGPAGPADSARPWASRRSLRLLLARADSLWGAPRTGSRLLRGTLAWHARQLRLASAVEASAWESVEYGEYAATEKLISLLVGADHGEAVHDLRLAVAVAQEDWVTSADLHEAGAIPAEHPGHAATATWVRRRRLELGATRLLEKTAAGPAVTGGSSPEALWAGGRDAEAVIAAIRRDPASGAAGSRYFEAFAARSVALLDGAELRSLRPVFDAWAASRTKRSLILAPPGAVVDLATGGLGRLRELVDGRRVCLVGDAARLDGSGLGPLVDAYDLVVRFGEFALSAPDTGARTDIHVTAPGEEHGWGVPARARILVAEGFGRWRDTLVERLQPGAQDWLGDETLRWPGDHWPSLPTGPVGEPAGELPAGSGSLPVFARLLVGLRACAAVDLVAVSPTGLVSPLL